MPADPPTARELADRAEVLHREAEELLDEVIRTTPPWLIRLESLAEQLHSETVEFGLVAGPTLTLIRGGRDAD